MGSVHNIANILKLQDASEEVSQNIKNLKSGDGGGTYDDMEKRVTNLEKAVASMATKADVQQVREDIGQALAQITLDNAKTTAQIVGRLDTLSAEINGKFGTLEAKVDGRFDALEAKADGKFAVIDEKLDSKIGAKAIATTTGIIIASLSLVIAGFAFFTK